MANARLSDAITDLRTELMEALERGASKQVRFDVGAIELELELVCSTEGSAKAETKWWVISAGGELKREQGATHRLKLILTPKLDGDNLRIAAKSKGID